MIRLESAPTISARCQLSIVSEGDVPSIQLAVSEYQERVGDQWITSRSKFKQEVVFITKDGPVTLTGVVPEAVAVQIASAYSVVLDVALEQKLKGAFEKGRVSQSYVAATILKVVEVYSAKNRKVYPMTTVNR